MRRLRKPLWTVILVISLVVLLGGIFFMFRYFLQNDTIDIPKGSTSNEAVVSGTESSESTEPAETTAAESFGYELEQYEEWTSFSFDELTEINSDIYAWIYIPGTKVDYPVAQCVSNKDDSYYLSHNIYKQYQFSGTIFSELQNKRNFSDPVTVLYGHNMLNGSMFATLHYFSDKDFFDSHTTCFVQTKDKIYTYLIYAAYVYDDRHILNSFNFHDPDVVQSYFDSTLNPRTYSGNFREGVELDSDSRILTLSTCTNGASNTRYLVQGVLVNEQPR